MNRFNQHRTRTAEADESAHSAFPDTCSTHNAKNQKIKKNESMLIAKKVNSDARYNDVILRPFHQNIAPFDLSLPLSHSSKTVAVQRRVAVSSGSLYNCCRILLSRTSEQVHITRG
jgi:hypothetical protein